MELTLDTLRRVPILAGLSDSALRLIAERSEQTMYRPGAVVLREGDSSNRLYIILGGSVRVCKNLGTSDEIELAKLGAGEFFGEMCILDCLPRSASVQVVTEAAILFFSSLVFWELHESNSGEYGLVVLNIARDLSRRLRHLDERLAAACKPNGGPTADGLH
jgi:CRP/FNR family transcriptional regulator, cyclic AMP receptor protein